MANRTTGAQRRNKKMDDIWEKSMNAKEKVVKKMKAKKNKEGYYEGHIKGPSGKSFKITKPTSKGWSESDEKAHQSDVKKGRSWNKYGSSGAKNPHL